jgi:hypothetical protein
MPRIAGTGGRSSIRTDSNNGRQKEETMDPGCGKRVVPLDITGVKCPRPSHQGAGVTALVTQS